MKDSGFAKLVDFVFARVASKTRYYGFYPYLVRSEIGTIPAARKLELIPIDTKWGLPPITGADKLHGVAGIYESLGENATVAVGFIAGDPAQPFVAQYNGTPITIEMIPSQKVKVYTATSPITKAVALAPPLASTINALQTWVNAVQAWAAAITPLVEPPIPGGPVTIALGTLTAATTALGLQTSAVVGPSTSGGMVSVTLEAS